MGRADVVLPRIVYGAAGPDSWL